MGNPRKLKRDQVEDFATVAATAIANGKVGGFTAPQNTALSDAITDANAQLAASGLNQAETKAAALAATQADLANLETLLNILSNARSAMESVDATPEEYAEVGFDIPDTTRTPVTPQTPSDLVARPVEPGINELTFKGNNASGSVTYVIEAKIGDTAPYVMVGTSTSQKFRHMNVIRGEFYQYHVRAQSRRGLTSAWSNEAVCYGM
jgi:hypothetical protein